MVNIPEADLGQLYANSIVMYDGHPVKVTRAGKQMRIYNLEHGKESTVPFNMERFKPVRSRLGNVNIDGCTFYVSRRPARRFSIGLTTANLVMQNVSLGPAKNYRRLHEALDKLGRLTGKEWVNTINGEYPTLFLAYKIAQKTEGICAFDRQFSVDYERRIFYKDTHVGVLPERTRATNRIEFFDGCKHLELLLDKKYEKTSRTIA